MISDVGNKILKLTFILSFLLSVFLSEAQISIGNDLSRINYEAPTDYIIGDIEVEGVEYLDENVIIMLSNLEVGEKIKVPGDAITGAIRRLWDQGLFDNISIVASDIKANKIFLKIILHERPRLSKFSFNGIRKTEADDIREKINLSRGDVVTDHLLIRTKNIIEDFYADKGFLNSEITITEKTDKRDINFIDLTIDIKKNKKVKIKEINIYGVTELSADAIKSSMRETKARGTFTPLKDLGPFVIDVATDVITLKFKELGNEFVSYFKQHFKVNLFKGSKYIKSNYK
ncbi:MAG: POTRA domain-containing protein, partial [Bacteroidales bacterium]|nr:POTRA domain-containing protein [Bacteroidales bacterium]